MIIESNYGKWDVVEQYRYMVDAAHGEISSALLNYFKQEYGGRYFDTESSVAYYYPMYLMWLRDNNVNYSIQNINGGLIVYPTLNMLLLLLQNALQSLGEFIVVWASGEKRWELVYDKKKNHYVSGETWEILYLKAYMVLVHGKYYNKKNCVWEELKKKGAKA